MGRACGHRYIISCLLLGSSSSREKQAWRRFRVSTRAAADRSAPALLRLLSGSPQASSPGSDHRLLRATPTKQTEPRQPSQGRSVSRRGTWALSSSSRRWAETCHFQSPEPCLAYPSMSVVRAPWALLRVSSLGGTLKGSRVSLPMSDKSYCDDRKAFTHFNFTHDQHDNRTREFFLGGGHGCRSLW